MAIMNNFTSGGAATDELTATPAEVMAGYKFLGAGSDEEQIGTLALTGNAVVNHVLQGETFYSTNPKQKLTGTMTVSSVLYFSAQVVSGRQILCKWQNPTTAIGKPFSGVCINYSTSGYPGQGGTRLYTGVGSSSASGATSQVYLNLPNLNTTYYLSCYSYVNINNGVDNKYGTVFNASVVTQNSLTLTFTSTQNYTVPGGYTLLDVFLVGGGSSGVRGAGVNVNSWRDSGPGGGGGYTNTLRNIGVAGGQVLQFNVGSGGPYIPGVAKNQSLPVAWNVGNASSVVRSGTTLASAAGGNNFNGGSGGGVNGIQLSYGDNNYQHAVGAGGTNGGNGGGTPATNTQPARSGGAGQGRTTTAWGAGGGTVYSGGGGGGAQPGAKLAGSGGGGGNYGGGKGGNAWAGGTNGESGNGAPANSGAGGGGGGGCAYYRGGGDGGGGGAGGFWYYYRYSSLIY